MCSTSIGTNACNKLFMIIIVVVGRGGGAC